MTKSAARSVLLPAELMQQVDAWIDARTVRKSTSSSQTEAVCELVRLGLGGSRTRQKPESRSAGKMAADQIDRMDDPSASEEQKASRKRRLLKGPKEFRDQRVDRPDESEQ